MLIGLGNGDAIWEELIRRPPEEAIPPQLPGRWWVAHTKPRNEKALALDLRALGVFAYLPLSHRVTRSRNTGRASRSIVPVFTGYVFFNAGDEQRRLAMTTNRIAGTLVVPNQGELIGQLWQIQRVLSSETEFEWGPSLVEGDWVRVVAGPLMGIEGVVSKRLKRTRLALNVKMLSQSVVVEVDRELLEKIDGPTFPVN
jgi:transcription antitermination factor NusG